MKRRRRPGGRRRRWRCARTSSRPGTPIEAVRVDATGPLVARHAGNPLIGVALDAFLRLPCVATWVPDKAEVPGSSPGSPSGGMAGKSGVSDGPEVPRWMRGGSVVKASDFQPSYVAIRLVARWFTRGARPTDRQPSGRKVAQVMGDLRELAERCLEVMALGSDGEAGALAGGAPFEQRVDAVGSHWSSEVEALACVGSEPG
jgi:hypothetical protein